MYSPLFQYQYSKNGRYAMNMNYYTYRRLVVSILFFSTVTFAQSGTSDSTFQRSNVWALQFGIAGNFSLTSFQGSTIGIKYQLSNKHAIRYGVTINGTGDDETGSYSGSINDTSLADGPGSRSTKNVNISGVVQYLWYSNPMHGIQIYAGAGPMISYSYYHSANEYSYLRLENSGGVTTRYWTVDSYYSTTEKTGAGVSGVLGVEWFALQWLSLHADYNENMLYQWGTYVYDDISYATITTPSYIPAERKQNLTIKGWTVTSGGVRFGVSVYF